MARPERILIWGGGGHGKVVADLVRACGGEVVGFVDRDPRKLGQVVEPGGAAVVLTESKFLQQDFAAAAPLPLGATAVALAVGDNAARARCRSQLRSGLAQALVHPTAAVSPSAALGRGTVVFARAVINAAATIGQGAIVNSGAIVEHDCIVGDDAHVSPGSVLAGGAHVGEMAWVGAGAVVLPGIRVGAGAIVGAGAVVTRDVPPAMTVVGVPANELSRMRGA